MFYHRITFHILHTAHMCWLTLSLYIYPLLLLFPYLNIHIFEFPSLLCGFDSEIIIFFFTFLLFILYWFAYGFFNVHICEVKKEKIGFHFMECVATILCAAYVFFSMCSFIHFNIQSCLGLVEDDGKLRSRGGLSAIIIRFSTYLDTIMLSFRLHPKHRCLSCEEKILAKLI